MMRRLPQVRRAAALLRTGYLMFYERGTARVKARMHINEFLERHDAGGQHPSAAS